MLGEYSTSGLFMEPIEYKNYETFFESEINPLSKLTDELKRYHNSKDIILFNSGFWALVVAIKSYLDQSLTTLRLNYADEVKKGESSSKTAEGDGQSSEAKED